MITYILGAILLVGLVMILTGYLRDNWGLEEAGRFTASIAGIAWFAVSFVVLLGTSPGDSSSSLRPAECDAELVAINTDRSTSSRGGFFLGIGSVNSSDYQTITYLEKSGEGIRLGEKRAYQSVIYEDGGSYMTCSQDTRTHKSDWLWPWAQETTVYGSPTYEFHIPEGSVVRNFEVAP